MAMERGYSCMPDVLLVSLQTELRYFFFLNTILLKCGSDPSKKTRIP